MKLKKEQAIKLAQQKVNIANQNYKKIELALAMNDIDAKIKNVKKETKKF